MKKENKVDFLFEPIGYTYFYFYYFQNINNNILRRVDIYNNITEITYIGYELHDCLFKIQTNLVDIFKCKLAYYLYCKCLKLNKLTKYSFYEHSSILGLLKIIIKNKKYVIAK